MTDYKLTQLENLVQISEAVSNENYGSYPTKRPISELLNYGLILLDKPPGNTSHEIVSYVKKILQLEKAGHSGTLDPGTTGLLPIGLEEGTKIIPVLLLGPKEYIALGRLHSHVPNTKLMEVIQEFTGPIFQKPPQRSSVKRQTRVRNVYELKLDDQFDRLLLLRVLCESGTYIRKLIYDIGEVLGVGASMIELRRTRVCNFSDESDFIRLHDLVDAFQTYKETKNEEKLRRIIHPIEIAMTHLPAVTVRDTAIDALCHGAQLAIPGVVSISKNIKKGDLVGIYSLKGEVVGLGVSLLDYEEFFSNKKGICFQIKRIVMKPNTYPKFWSTTATTTATATIDTETEKEAGSGDDQDSSTATA
ncbi:RNA-guided pseudouridylation complex pseudouridine synthase subunit Cbf5 [Candidatus Nitrosocosmicus franklandus]|uniref:Probable tRNA pseudouridine synthase B n=1 Tax=Candidatus Nitrosocosmicus franklandianus TaxID=1798806 RepID=A0A484IBF4_9ARCH|nr:RNA-guided pseudouridylation complex pseudouridine synthase subunit Cbf5 [Candidatus Nitrosocosmicus franklandus]VFJ15084.1 putative tRNA pseudouridine synthase B [Candidatus Nitrosocosmicus franklandus]